MTKNVRTPLITAIQWKEFDPFWSRCWWTRAVWHLKWANASHYILDACLSRRKADAHVLNMRRYWYLHFDKAALTSVTLDLTSDTRNHDSYIWRFVSSVVAMHWCGSISACVLSETQPLDRVASLVGRGLWLVLCLQLVAAFSLAASSVRCNLWLGLCHDFVSVLKASFDRLQDPLQSLWNFTVDWEGFQNTLENHHS